MFNKKEFVIFKLKINYNMKRPLFIILYILFVSFPLMAQKMEAESNIQRVDSAVHSTAELDDSHRRRPYYECNYGTNRVWMYHNQVFNTGPSQIILGQSESYSLTFEEKSNTYPSHYYYVNGKIHYLDEDGNLIPYASKSETVESHATASGALVVYEGSKSQRVNQSVLVTNTSDLAESENNLNRQSSATPLNSRQDFQLLSPGFFITHKNTEFSYINHFKNYFKFETDAQNGYYQLFFKKYFAVFCRSVQDEIIANRTQSADVILALLEANPHCINREQLLSLIRADFSVE